ncbi:potassium/sodium hyperpolarization-activated cyclic nucleotide-gated channel 4-like [Uranotaenia lowii]|uniref:potassium/sodium hyperpolarization-activated cyclic nucleotide-gated channel 4-like n=1 Tax=Uranotaenia lowii TaxID=190385 RepID=UPI002478ABC2|nr:potassium/sodium hyperpolarization-activated cyclic nucleotide-gated channel 4-like [Uranotaenia lowii]
MKESSDTHRCHLRHNSGTHLPPVTEHSSKWDRALRRFRKLFVLSPRHPDTDMFFRSFSQLDQENRRLVEDYPACIIHPLSVFRLYWEMVIFFVMIIHSFLLVFVVCYLIYIDEKHFDAIIGFDLFLCAVLMVEVVLKFITGYVVKKSKSIVLEPRKIFWNNLKCFRVVYHLLGVFPFILFLPKLNRSYYDSQPLFYLVIVLFLYLTNICRYQVINKYYEVIPKFFKASENVITITKLLIASLHVLHWTSCVGDIIPLIGYHSISKTTLPEWHDTQLVIGKFLVDVYREIYREGYYPGRPNSAMDLQEYKDFRNYLFHLDFPLARTKSYQYVMMKLDDAFRHESILGMYIRAVMDSIQVSLLASQMNTNGLASRDHLVTSYLVLTGWMWLTYMMFRMVQIIISKDLSETKYNEIINELKAFGFNRRLSSNLKGKLLEHFANRYQMHYFDEESILNSLSSNLRRSIRMETCHHLVNNVELFKNLPHTLIEDIVDRLVLEIFLENDVIIEAGRYGNAMYFIASGTAGVYSINGKELSHLVDGAHFGEICVIKKEQKRTANVVALEMCEVYKLSYVDFQELIEPHSYLLERMKKLAEERMVKTLGAMDKVSEVDVYDNFLQ